VALSAHGCVVCEIDCGEHRATSLDELRAALAQQRAQLTRNGVDKPLMLFAFEFCKETEDSKVVDITLATALVSAGRVVV
jgi:hypothetical protein